MSLYNPELEVLGDIRDLLVEIRDMLDQFMSEPDTDAIVLEEAAALNRGKES